MAAISWANRIRDYLITEGLASAIATFYQTMVDRITTAYADEKEDPELILGLDLLTRDIMDVAVATFGFGLNQANTLVWIQANRPYINATEATLLSYIVATDLNTNLVPSSIYTVALGKYAYQVAVSNVVMAMVRYMRHFATAQVYRNDGTLTSPIVGPLKYNAPLPNGHVVL